MADRIIVIENGKIVEDGTHLSLLQNNQRYAELFRCKQEKYTFVNPGGKISEEKISSIS